jgi:alpha-D-ribose 1-methylphosphonate 5-phosphate C-P lyase
LEFDDVFFQVEGQQDWICRQTGAQHKFMNEIPMADGSSAYELSDTGYAEKLATEKQGNAVTVGSTYYDAEGNFYHAGYLKSNAAHLLDPSHDGRA